MFLKQLPVLEIQISRFMENNIMTATVIYCNELETIMSTGPRGDWLLKLFNALTEYMSGDIKATQSNARTVALSIKELR